MLIVYYLNNLYLIYWPEKFEHIKQKKYVETPQGQSKVNSDITSYGKKEV